MVDHSGPNLYKPPDYRLYGRLDALAPKRHIPDHVKQIVGKTSDEKPGLIGCEAVATRFVPAEGVLPFFYPVFDLSSTIVNRNYLLRFKVRVGHDKSDTGKKFTHMPFDFTDNPPGLNLFLRLVLKLDHPDLHAALWRATGGPLQVRRNVHLQAIVAGKPNEINDTLLFAKLVQVWACKGRIPPELKLPDTKLRSRLK
jgi:hypothetical protein